MAEPHDAVPQPVAQAVVQSISHPADCSIVGCLMSQLGGLADRYDLGALSALLETPTPPMPAYPLSDGERRDLAVYLLTAYP